MTDDLLGATAVMARKLRVQYPGAIYHVLNWGDRREPIFRTDQDRVLFIDTLAETMTGGTAGK